MSKELFLKNKKVVIMGLGVHGGGVGVASWVARHGANVLVTDLKTNVQLKLSIKQLEHFRNIKYRLGKHLFSDFKNADIVVANPMVRQNNKFLKAAKKNKVEIYNDISLFMKFCPCSVIGITGTKGKSTTAALIYHLLKTGKPRIINLPQYVRLSLQGGRRIFLGGNIRISPFSFLDKLKRNDLVILEISSWQAEGLINIKKSPQVALLTNLGIDHLNTYKSFADYARAKALIFKYQSDHDYAIFNKQDKYSQRFAKRVKSNKRFFNIKSRSGNYFAKGYLYYRNKKLLAIQKLPLRGDHNKANILAALAVCEIFNISASKIKTSLLKFKTLSGRMETIRRLDKITYINDTTATAPIAAESSINSIVNPIILIAGGNDKKLDLDKLALIIMSRVNYLSLLPGTATDKLLKIFRKNKFVDYEQAPTMFKAVQLARSKAMPGDVVLLSPGATSFGLFTNEFDRGDKFIQAVKNLK